MNFWKRRKMVNLIAITIFGSLVMLATIFFIPSNKDIFTGTVKVIFIVSGALTFFFGISNILGDILAYEEQTEEEK